MKYKFILFSPWLLKSPGGCRGIRREDGEGCFFGFLGCFARTPTNAF